MTGARAAHERVCRRWSRLALLACASVAIAGLPRSALPMPWQVALLLPAALLAATRWTDRWPLWHLAAAAALQVAACMLAYDAAGPLLRPAALAGTILPPLAFVTVRHHDADAALGQFLSFCVLLVGTILGETRHALLAAYVLAAVLQLRCDSRLRALRIGTAPRFAGGVTRGRWFATAGWLGVSCALVAFAVERTLGFVPAPTAHKQQAAAPTGPGPRRAGLSDTFDLGGDGSVLELRGERLVVVAGGDNAPVPDDLYLRSGFFQEPGLTGWRIGPLARERRDASRADWRLHLPLPGTEPRRLELTRLQGARNTVFVPPGTCSIIGLPDLLGDAPREWFRQLPGSRVDVYEVIYQDLPPPVGLPVDPRWDAGGMLALPVPFDPSLFQPLLDDFRPRGSALQRAAAIANGLQARCRYERREPGGPYGNPLLDFLHGERIGFCMHFASAAAILLRMSGVPCRIGVGLYGGTPTADGQRVFGSQHSHAWVEIPITGRGWVVFDPTPPALRGTPPDPNGVPADAAGSADDVLQPSLLDSIRNAIAALLATVWPWLFALLLLLLPLGRRRNGAAAPTVLARAVRPARRWLLQILRALNNRGFGRGRGTTLEQYVAALLAAESCPDDLRAALLVYQDVRFGGRPWNRAREQSMQLGLAAAESLPPRSAGSPGGAGAAVSEP